MRVPYFAGNTTRYVEVFSACPGCGRIYDLAMHDVVQSYMHDQRVWYIGCKCGWRGPDAQNAVMAAVKWDARAMIYG